jgi:hypothetical protein
MSRDDRQRPLFETQDRGLLEARSSQPLLQMFLLGMHQSEVDQ